MKLLRNEHLYSRCGHRFQERCRVYKQQNLFPSIYKLSNRLTPILSLGHVKHIQLLYGDKILTVYLLNKTAEIYPILKFTIAHRNLKTLFDAHTHFLWFDKVIKSFVYFYTFMRFKLLLHLQCIACYYSNNVQYSSMAYGMNYVQLLQFLIKIIIYGI